MLRVKFGLTSYEELPLALIRIFEGDNDQCLAGVVELDNVFHNQYSNYIVCPYGNILCLSYEEYITGHFKKCINIIKHFSIHLMVCLHLY